MTLSTPFPLFDSSHTVLVFMLVVMLVTLRLSTDPGFYSCSHTHYSDLLKSILMVWTVE